MGSSWMPWSIKDYAKLQSLTSSLFEAAFKNEQGLFNYHFVAHYSTIKEAVFNINVSITTFLKGL